MGDVAARIVFSDGAKVDVDGDLEEVLHKMRADASALCDQPHRGRAYVNRDRVAYVEERFLLKPEDYRIT